jgi:malonyl-CoA O-methyltransferase
MSLERQLDKTKVKGSFAQAARTYDSVADLQRRVGQGLLAQILACNLDGLVVDIGCGTGFLSRELASVEKILQVIGLDIALPMLQTTRQKIDWQNLSLLCADAEFLPFTAQSVNHIVSNLALQWCENLSAVFSEVKRVLKPDGQLIFSTFGGQTLQELKAAWANVDDYSHVNSFYTAIEIANFLQQTGFQQVETQVNIYQSNYDSVFALMHELKAIGAHNVTAGRRKSMTGKVKMRAMIAEYDTLRCDGTIPATFEIITVTARV